MRVFKTSAYTLLRLGHLAGAPATDVLVRREEVRFYPGSPVDSPHTHGTGCTFSAAIATGLAAGLPLSDAIDRAKTFVTEAIRHGLAVGTGTGPTDPFFFLRRPDASERWVNRLHAAPAGDRNGRER